MKRSSAPIDHVPQCALKPQDITNTGNTQPHIKDDSVGKFFPRFNANRGSSNNLHNVQRQIKQEYPVTQEWPSTFENSNTSWESDWIATSSTPLAKSNATSGGFYKQRNTPSSYQSSSNDWSTGDSSTSSVPSGYAAMHTSHQSSSNSLSASSSSYYENNNFYGGGYNYDSNLSGYVQPSYRSSSQTQQQYHQQSVRPCDPVTGSYTGNRNPSSCPPTQVKQPVPDYNQRNTRYGMDNMFNKVQIKKEPEDYTETEGENFTSLFTKSLTSLYSEDPDNAFREDGKSYEPDIIVCSPPPSVSSMDEQQTNYQRLGASGGHYNNSTTYQSSRNNSFGFYESRNQTVEPTSNVVELGSENDRTNSFRYDRPSFDDMHLYASPNDSKSQTKKRKLSMPNIAPEGNFAAENRRKAPRLLSFKSDSKWTPNSFAFSDIQIKQEPEDDYSSPEKDVQNNSKSLVKDNSPNSNGNSNSKSPQLIDHPKPVPRKRSPAATCFDRFEKKSTPTNKKVSPLSVYAKVQDSIVLNVKCRRYKKRTKPIVNKEEAVYPGREEIENWKRTGAYSQTPDHAVRILMGELLERVSQVDGKTETDGPDLTQLDPLKVRELLFQFCQRYSIDFRDFEDINNVLKPRLIKDKMAKNSERASAIRKRTSISPVRQELEAELVSKTPKVERVSKKSSNEDLKPAVRRVLRNLPGREQLPELVEQEIRPSRRSNKTPIVRRRYSTRSANVDERNSSDVDIVIDSSTDRESEAGKEAEVRKKSERLKNKQIVAETPAKDMSSERKGNVTKNNKKEEACTRSREKSKEIEKSKDALKTNSKKKWSRLHNDSTGFLRSPSIEIVDITRSDSSSPSDSSKDVNEFDVSASKKLVKKPGRNSRNVSEGSSKETSQRTEVKVAPNISNRKKLLKNQEKKSSDGNDNQTQSENCSKVKKETKLSKEIRKTETLCNSGDILQHKRRYQFLKDKDKKKELAVEADTDSDVPKLKKELQCIKESDKKNNSSVAIAANSKCKKSKIAKESDKNINSVLSNKLNSKCADKLQKGSDKNNATENEKSSALLRNTKSNSKIQENSDKHPCQTQSKRNQSSEESVKFVGKKIKVEPLSPNTGSSELKQFDYPIKKETKAVQIALNKPDIIEYFPKKSEQEAKKAMDNKEVRNKVAKSSVQLPTKQLQRRNSQHSDSELQVVLMKLPDVHINSKIGSIPLEVFERCVSKENKKTLVSEDANTKSEDDFNIRSPPELVSINDINTAQNDVEISEGDSELKNNSDQKDGPPTPLSLMYCDTAVNSEMKKSVAIKNEPQPIMQLRYSADSEDSECGLIIDLDRRVSTEEQSPTLELNRSASMDQMKELSNYEENLNLPSKEESSFSISEETTIASIISNITLQVEQNCNALLRKASDECVIRQPNEDSVTAVSSIVALTTAGPLETLSESLTDTDNNEQTKTKEHSRAESILRSLLLETTGDGSTGPSRPSTSSALSEDSKSRITENVRQFLLTQVSQGAFLASMSPGNSHSAYEDMKLALDQLPDINANLLADTEECVHDPKMFKERVDRLKHEIMYLQCVAYQKEKERIGMICLKRYMEEVMRRLIKKYNFEQRKQEKQKEGECSSEFGEASCSYLPESCCSYQPEASTSAETTLAEGTHLQSSSAHQIIKMSSIALSIAKTEGPSKAVDNDERLSTLSGEKLPTVETMIAKATENYGVDMRTVERCSTTTKQTILQKVLSSKESVYSHTASGSSIELRNSEQTSTHHQQSVKIFQKKIPSGGESPFKPFCSTSSSLELKSNEKPLHQNILHNVLSKELSCSPRSSQSPPTLQPEVKMSMATSSSSPSTSFENDYPLDFSLEGKSISSSKSSDIPFVPIKLFAKKSPKSIIKSSPKCSSGTSYSVWSKAQATKSASSATATDLRINNVKAQEKITIETTTSAPSCSNSPGFVMVPSSSQVNFSPKLLPSIDPQSHSESATHSEKPLKSCVEKNYSIKTEEELRALSYSSLVTSSNTLSYGGHAGSITPTFTITKPPGTTTPNGSPYRCMGCGISDAKFLCSGCRDHWYCSAQCQNMRWPEHSQVCRGNMYSSDAGPSYPSTQF